MITRSTLTTTLRRALQDDEAVDAVWEGGSAAFGRDDEFSDIDLYAIVADDSLHEVFTRVETALESLSPVTLRVDMPSQPGYEQKFYRLQDADESLVVDLELIRRSDPVLFREVELHGVGCTWFDRSGVLVESHLDIAADLEKARARVDILAPQFDMFQHLVLKEIARGHGCDALDFYHEYTLRPLVEALRLLHAPHTRIFGLRYFSRDLPGPVVTRVEALAFVGSMSQLRERHAQASEWGLQCLRRLRALGPGAGID